MSFESIDRLFCRSVDRHVGAVAVEVAGQELTYGDLEARTNHLANLLRASGPQVGEAVGIFSDQTLDVILAVIACLKAGAMFVPIDPHLPPLRRAMMLSQVEPSWLLVARERVADLLASAPEAAGAARLVVMGDQGRSLRLVEGEAPDEGTEAVWDPSRRLVDADPDQPCYVYFTSGSTGTPKGIVGRLKGIDHFIRWEIDTLGLEPGVRVSQLTGFAFDAFLRDLFVPLCAGGTLCVPPGVDTLTDPQRLADWIEERQIHLAHSVPSLFRLLLEPGLTPPPFATLRYVLLAGEPLLPADVEKWQQRYGEGARLVNLYGPTETTMTKFCYFVQPADRERSIIPIGTPIRGAAAVVVDEAGEICAPGQVGEILIRTPYRTLGYLGDPEQTRKVFVPNPFSNDPADLVYRTGDLGRVGEEGLFELVGRRDQQVKIRGMRVEPGEVESVLHWHPAVREAAVVAWQDGSVGPSLCAYLLIAEGSDAGELREFAAARLPDFMVPSQFIEIEEIPRTITGKIDRKALPAPTSARRRQAGQAARTMVEELLREIWSELLHLDSVGVRESFFDLGGDSLVAGRVLGRVAQVVGVEVPLRSFFATPTVAGLARAIDELRAAAGEAAPAIPIERLSDGGGEHRLSFSQERLFFLHQLLPTSSAYNLVSAFRFTGGLVPAILERSLNEVVRRHEVLRTTFAVKGGKPVQRVGLPVSRPLPVIDLTSLPKEVGVDGVRLLSWRLAQVPFDLARGPLVRWSLVRRGDDDHVLVVVMHHIVADGWSEGVLLRDLGALYEGFAHHRAPDLPKLPIQYADFAAWQRRHLAGEVLAAHLGFWRRQLGSSHPLLELPGDRPRPPVVTSRGRRRYVRLPEGMGESLRGLGRAHGATLFMIFLAAFQVLLARYSGQRDIRVGIPVAGRGRPETEGLIGMFGNTLVVRGDLAPPATFVELLVEVREALLDAHAHQDMPFEKLVEALQPERDLGHSPLFQVMFAFQNVPREAPAMEVLEVSRLPTDRGAAPFDLTLALAEKGGWVSGFLEYRIDLFDATTIDRLFRHFTRLLAVAAERPERPAASLPLLTAAEEGQLLVEWNDGAAVYPLERPFGELLAEQTARAPDAVAVVWRQETLSYRALDRRAGVLAARLVRAGVGPERVTPVLAERDLDFWLTALAVLRAGGAYLPLDPRHPGERQAAIIERSGARLVLAVGTLAGTLRAHLAAAAAGAPRLLELGELLAEAAGEEPAKAVAAGRLAYVIFTSGSTGIPKGAMVESRGMLNHLCAKIRDLGLTANDAVAQTASQCFDISVWQFLAPLLVGGRVHLLEDEAALDPGRLLGVAARQRLTVLELVPSLLRALLDKVEQGEPASLPGLRWMISTGEALPAEVCRRWLARYPDVPVLNAYGPTECSDDVTHHVLRQPPAEGVRIPIGRRLDNIWLYVLDGSLRPVPAGVSGELYVGGEGVGRGYLREPRRTAPVFLPNPFRGEGGRLYRTGDLVRVRPDGALELLGRFDHQVKLRGFRIELGEIEAALTALPGVSEGAVVLREEEGDRRLVAYFVPVDAAPPGDLRESLAARLPEYMLPSVFVSLDKLPLTANGKLDRKALPVPDRVRPDLGTAYQPPGSRIERTLAEIWQGVLPVDKVGVYDNFFDLGGHSLLLLQVHGEIEERLGAGVSLIELFQYPTVATLAARINRQQEADPLAAERQERHLERLPAGRRRLARRRAVASVEVG